MTSKPSVIFATPIRTTIGTFGGSGAIAHGHPIGATGAILTTRLIHSTRRDGLRRGIVTLCIGGGQGIALAIETVA